MANVHRIQDLPRAGSGQPSTGRNLLAGLSDQDVRSTDLIKKCIEYRVPFFSGTPSIKNPRLENYWDFLVAAMCPVLRLLSFTLALCIIDIALFATTCALGLNRSGELLQVNEATLIKFRGAYPPYIYKGQVDRLIVAMFLHTNFMHIFGNLITTLVIVSRVEYTYQPIWTIIIYILSGIAGNILAVVTTGYPYATVNVGASTALYGMIGLLIGYVIINWRGMNFMPIAMRLKLLVMLLLIIAMAIIFTLGQKNISYMGHLGGFLGGLWLSGIPPSIIVEKQEKIIRGIFIAMFVVQMLICFLVFYLGIPKLKEIAHGM